MIKQESEALDQSLALLEAGSTLEECLALHPEHSTDLRPLLEIVLQVRQVPSPTSSSAASVIGKQKMLQALAEKERQRAPLPSLFSRSADRVAALFKRYGPQMRAPAFQFTLITMTVLALFVCVSTLSLPWVWRSATQSATLTQVVGTVEIMPAGSDTWRPASAGEWVKEGDQVRTRSLSAATLVFFDKSATDLEADTEVVITQMRSQRNGDRVVVLYQSLGQTYSQVQRSPDITSRFEIETPTAVTTVRGTEFTLTVEADGTTHVMVAEGVVDVTAQGTTVALRAGQETTVRADQPSTPVHTVTPTPQCTSTPQATETPTSTGTPEPTETLAPTETPKPTATPEPTETLEPTEVSEPGETPESPSPSRTHQPPGLTKTPQPPGQTRQPPPAPTKKPKPTKRSN